MRKMAGLINIHITWSTKIYQSNMAKVHFESNSSSYYSNYTTRKVLVEHR